MSATPASVLMITARWARDGGVGAHVESSAELLAARGTRVSVLAARIESERRMPGVTLLHRPDLFKDGATASQKLAEALAQEPQLVHIHHVDDPDIVAAARAVAPVVISAHSYTGCPSGVYYFRAGHDCTRAHGPGCYPNMLLRGCAHARNPLRLPGQYRSSARSLEAVRRADMAVSYSSAVDRHLAVNGIARRRIVPYFPTMDTAREAPREPGRRVICAGRIIAPKGVQVLIRAARELDAEVVVCGDGPKLESMRTLARRLRVQEKVRFTGWLGPRELAAQIAGAAVVALPSLWPEPFGLVGIEGFAAGRPAVASATGGIGDWLEHGVSGLCVAPGDAGALAAALGELLEDGGRRERYGEAGRRTVAERFSRERHLRELEAAYASALAQWSTDTAGRSRAGSTERAGVAGAGPA